MNFGGHGANRMCNQQQYRSPLGQQRPQHPPNNWNHNNFGDCAPFNMNSNCWNGPPRPPGPPCPTGPPGMFQPPRPQRQRNNVWGDPDLYQPKFATNHGGGAPPPFPPPPGMFQQMMNHRRGGSGNRGRRGGRQGPGPERGGPGSPHQQQGPPFERHQNGGRGRGRHPNNQQNSKARKRKPNKILPENHEFYCETCDRGFKTDEKYQEHIASHTKCSYEGCRYVAHPKLVQFHIDSQHKTGAAKKIWSMETTDDIKKWIEERKRNFPTQENIHKKAEALAARLERGEVLETKQFGKMNERKRRRKHGRRWKEEMNLDRTDSISPQKDRKSDASADAAAKRHKADSPEDAPPTKRIKSDDGSSNTPGHQQPSSNSSRDPLSFLLDDSINAEESDEDVEKEVLPRPEMFHGQGLASLMASYESDASEKEGDEDEDCDLHNNSAASSNVNSKPEASTHDSGKEDEPANSIEATSVNEPATEEPQDPEAEDDKGTKKGGRRKRNKAPRPQQNQSQRKSSLLEMLLAGDIRRERNIILQCVHHIVKNRFLGITKE